MAHEAAEKNLVAVLLQDHDQIRMLFSQLEQARYADRRREAARELSALLVRHSAAEEMHLYPEVRESLRGGGPLADQGLEEHRELERLLKRWRHEERKDDAFASLLQQLRTAVLPHLEQEERELFPAIEAALPVERLHELALRIEQTERIGPTRPHPAAPHHPPVNKLIGPGVGIVDHLRDRMTRRSP